MALLSVAVLPTEIYENFSVILKQRNRCNDLHLVNIKETVVLRKFKVPHLMVALETPRSLKVV